MPTEAEWHDKSTEALQAIQMLPLAVPCPALLRSSTWERAMVVQERRFTTSK